MASSSAGSSDFFLRCAYRFFSNFFYVVLTGFFLFFCFFVVLTDFFPFFLRCADRFFCF
ncbi:uncharacterized protein DS421_8g233620 [Arachis hypogaea]|nr:uncharacterized protein DS421_8g233620 [Arachis hypogaea]